MNTPTDVFSIVQEMSEGNTVPLNLFFCRLTRCMKAAAFLQQCLYWSKRSTMKGGWFAKSYAEFEEEIFLGDEAVKKAATMLVDMGILEVEKRRFNGAPTLHYRLHGQALIEWLSVLIQFEKEHESDDKPAKFHYKDHLSRFPRVRKSSSEGTEMDFRTVGKRLPRMRKSITETTTKTTTETTKGVAVTPPAPSLALSVENVSTPDNTPQIEAVHDTHSGSRSRLTPSPDSAPPPPPAKLTEHPFIQVYREVFRRYPNKAQMAQLVPMTVTPPGLLKWQEVCSAWLMAGYKPDNLRGILDWYSAGGPPSYGRSANSRRTPTPPPVSPYTAMSEADKAAYLASCEPMED